MKKIIKLIKSKSSLIRDHKTEKEKIIEDMTNVFEKREEEKIEKLTNDFDIRLTKKEDDLIKHYEKIIDEQFQEHSRLLRLEKDRVENKLKELEKDSINLKLEREQCNSQIEFLDKIFSTMRVYDEFLKTEKQESDVRFGQQFRILHNMYSTYDAYKKFKDTGNTKTINMPPASLKKMDENE